MSDPLLEKFHIRRFLETADLTPDAPPAWSDAPDCFLRFAGGLVGLEHREFYYPPKPGEKPQQELDALQTVTVERARRLFRENGGPALYVDAIFDDRSTPRTKSDTYDLAERLARVVASNGWAQSMESREIHPCRELPEIHSYSVMPSVDGVDELWQGGAGAWFAPVRSSHIQDVLDEKRHRYHAYATRAPEVWLLVVNDMWRGGVPCEIDDHAVGEEYSTSFDRVYWLEVISDKALRLRTRPVQPSSYSGDDVRRRP